MNCAYCSLDIIMRKLKHVDYFWDEESLLYFKKIIHKKRKIIIWKSIKPIYELFSDIIHDQNNCINGIKTFGSDILKKHIILKMENICNTCSMDNVIKYI